MAKCVHLLRSVCSRSTLRAAKTVRSQMLSMDALLAADPDVRVIHLLRDPRGVVSSRRSAHDVSVIGRYSLTGNSSEKVRREAVVYCRTAVRDIRVRQVLEDRYPGRILTLNYEDVVVDLHRHADLVYRFLGVGSAPNETRVWIDKNNAAVAKAKALAAANMSMSVSVSVSRHERLGRRSARSKDKASKPTRNVYESPLEKWKKRLAPADSAAIVNDHTCREYFRLARTNPS